MLHVETVCVEETHHDEDLGPLPFTSFNVAEGRGGDIDSAGKVFLANAVLVRVSRLR